MSKISPIHVQLDGSKLCRISMNYSSTCAQLIDRVSQGHNLRNVSILDNDDYPIATQDESKVLIKDVLNEQNIVRLVHQETKFGHDKRPSNSENYNTNREQTNNANRNSWFINELFSISKWLWHLFIKPLIIVSILGVLCYFAYLKIICVQMSFLPIVTMYCPASYIDSIVVPSVSDLAEKSASLADVLMDTDVSAPMRLIHGKSSLIEIRSRIIYSDIDPSVRLTLGNELGELQPLIQTCADDLTDMLASFGGTLDRLQIYTKYLFDDVSKIIDERGHSYQDQITNYQKADIQKALTMSSDEYLSLINTQADKILEKAQRAHQGVLLIRNKLETIQELSYKGQHISEQNLDELEHGSRWSWLFGNDQFSIVKNKRNLKILAGFSNYIMKASVGLNDIIGKLKYFRSDTENLKATGILFEQLPHIPIRRHQELLDLALKRLHNSKEKLTGKMQTQQQINEDD